MSNAPIVVADEPTGNLDSVTSGAIVAQLRRLHRNGVTVVLVTHDDDVAAVAERTIALRDGHVVADDREIAAGDARWPGRSGADASPSHYDGQGARLRPGDLLREALSAVESRPGRTAALIGAVAVAVALVILTAGLAQTASSQVSDRFDAQRNREVTVTAPASASGSARLVDSAERRVRSLAGVDEAGTLTVHDQVLAQAIMTGPTQRLPLVGVSPGLLRAAGARVLWSSGHPHRVGAREALLGAVPAAQLELAPLAADPVVLADGVPLAVVGIVRHVRRAPELLGSIVITTFDSATFGDPLDVRVLLETVPGAAPQVARQAPIALDPTAAERFEVDAPADPDSLRDEIQSDLAVTLIVLTVVAALASMIGVANAMMVNVIERTSEIGLRRAIGARPIHVLSQVSAEALLLGLAGGGLGFSIGTLGVLMVTVSKQWQPVLDLRLIPVALAGGAIVGVVGGLAAAVRASQIQPSDALRR